MTQSLPFCFFSGGVGSMNSAFLLIPGSGGFAGPGCNFNADLLQNKMRYVYIHVCNMIISKFDLLKSTCKKKVTCIYGDCI